MKHIKALDGLRGVAVLMVVLFHTLHADFTKHFIDDAFIRMARALDVGVDIFFVLSGFLITGILYDSKERPKFFTTFYARRTLRIFPLYYAVVAVGVIPPFIFPVLQQYDLRQLDYYGAAYWFYLSNIYGEAHPLLGVSWSLAIEEQFYLLWPLAVFALNGRRLLGLCATLVVVGLAYRIAVGTEMVTWPPAHLFSRIDLLAMGAAVSILLRIGPSALVEKQALRALTTVGVTTLVAIFIEAEGLWGDHMSTYGSSAVGILTIATILAIAGPRTYRPIQRFFESNFLRVWGKYSYAVYFFHSPLDALVRRIIGGPETIIRPIAGSQLPMQLVYSSIVAAISLGFALISWNLYEKHWLKLKDRFPTS